MDLYFCRLIFGQKKILNLPDDDDFDLSFLPDLPDLLDMLDEVDAVAESEL